MDIFLKRMYIIADLIKMKKISVLNLKLIEVENNFSI